MKSEKYSSFNELFAKIIIEELLRNNINTAFISPGSRSTPLTSAIAYNKNFKSHIHFDERGASFAALGYARATGRAGVLVCTSGSAGANYYPAVCEASVDGVPMVILTADRPRELHACGANQTFDQHNLYGKHVKAFVNFEAPEEYMSLYETLEKFCDAVQQTQELTKGPVHINCMFREPLEFSKKKKSFKRYTNEISAWMNSSKPFLVEHKEKQPFDFKYKFNSKLPTFIIAGALENDIERKSVVKFAEKFSLPIFADIRAGLRLDNNCQNIIHYYDHIVLSEFMKTKKRIQILHIGGNLVSKRLLQFIEQADIENYTVIHSSQFAYNPHHKLTDEIFGSIEKNLTKLSKLIKPFSKTFLTKLIKASKLVDSTFENTIHDFSEMSIARLTAKHIEAKTFLTLGNSLSVRCVDMYASADKKKISIVSNRGLSGIDGTLATAIGYANGADKRGTVLLGDLAFHHDINSLAMLSNLKHPLVIIVLNNNGGKIFSYLPIAAQKDIYQEYFETPQNVTFEQSANQYKLKYLRINSNEQFAAAYNNAQKESVSTILEIDLKDSKPLEVQRTIMKEIKQLKFS